MRALRKARGAVALLALSLLPLGCDGQLGDFCRSDDDCGGGLRCSTREGARGVCTYPAGADDLGSDSSSSRDSRAADAAVDGPFDGSTRDGAPRDTGIADTRPDAIGPDAAFDSLAIDAPAQQPDLANDAPPLPPADAFGADAP